MDRIGQTRYDHPAFGCVTVSKWHSNVPIRLFGSDLGHKVGISLTFHTAYNLRGLSDDRHMADKIILRVNLSEAQWARLVASQGIGNGVPVTMEMRRFGQLVRVPDIAAPQASKREIHGEEMAEALREQLDALRALADKLGKMLDGGAVSKTALREVHREIARHVEQAPGSVKFIYDQFASATEQVAEDAKVEVEAHVTSLATRLGMEQLLEAAPLLTDGAGGKAVKEEHF
jgi:hypothetical protein